MLACYMVLIQHWPPHLALAPLVQMDPPCMPFRDAGYSQADYILTVQDVVYGVWKAKVDGLKKNQKYMFKYIVDGQWCYDFTKDNEDDGTGNINNVITVS